MPRLRIPEAYRAALRTLLALDDASIAELVSALQGEPPTMRPDELSSHLMAKVERIPRDVLEDIMNTLIALYAVRAAQQMSVTAFARDVSEATGLDIPPESRQAAQDRLAKLLGLQPLLVTAKALDVLTDYERSYHDARTFTEVRPVFLDSVEDPLGAAAIVHTLKIRYHYEGELREFFIAMNPSNIDALRKVLDRADAKARRLSSLLDSAGLLYLEPENP